MKHAAPKFKGWNLMRAMYGKSRRRMKLDKKITGNDSFCASDEVVYI